MGRKGLILVAIAILVLVTTSLRNRANIIAVAEKELLARTDVLAEFFDGTLTSLSLGARMLENAPDLDAMNDLALALPLLHSVAIYENTGELIRAVPPGLFAPGEPLDPELLVRHTEQWEETAVSADTSAQRLRLSRVLSGYPSERPQIAVLTTSVHGTLARLPEAFEAPVYGAALIDVSGAEFFHYTSQGHSHEENCVVRDIDADAIPPHAGLISLERSDQIVAGKQLSDFPLRLILTFDTALVLEPWWRSTIVYSSIALGLIAVIIIVDFRLQQQSDRRAAVEQQVATLSSDVADVSGRLQTARGELSDLAYVVAHDLKAPLRGISQLSGWLIEDQGDRLDDDGRNMLDMLQQRVSRMNAMIEGILSYSRVNRDALTPETVDLQEVIETTIEEIALPDCVTISCSQDLPVVTGDPVQLRRLFQNLIDNAARVVTPSRGTIRVEAHHGDPNYSIVDVRDNGPGIDPKHHEKVFRPLHTVEGTASESGTGMGLAMCRKIALRHGGSLTISSSLGAGTVMSVRLPREDHHE